MTAADPAPPDNGAPPSLARRMAAFVYEGILLFGVLVMAAYLYGTLTQQRHALQGQAGLQAFLFVVLAIYFVWFWSHGGQTVALRAWHIRLVTHDGRPVTQRRALLRYLASWIWFLPALASARVIGLDSPGPIFALLTAGVLVMPCWPEPAETASSGMTPGAAPAWSPGGCLCGGHNPAHDQRVQGSHRHRPHRAGQPPLGQRPALGVLP